MSEKLKALYNTLCQIETKGDNTMIMGDCLKFVREFIKECAEHEKKYEKLEAKYEDDKADEDSGK